MLPKMSFHQQPTVCRFVIASLVATLALSGTGKAEDRPINFANDVVPVLTKAGCNTGACHAKAGGGQNGFQLSLFGFEPSEDFSPIVLEGRGRRVMFANPDLSLLLGKASAQVAHGGGLRLPMESAGYATIRDWIGQGAPRTPPDSTEIVDLQIEPSKGSLPRQSSQQLRVLARYSDGSTRDVTELALYESNDPALLEVSDGGLVQVLDLPGKVAVMVRYQARVTVFNATVPLGAPMGPLPPEKNFVDAAVFANLKELGIPPSPVCDDATFIRRVTLDIAGRLPTQD